MVLAKARLLLVREAIVDLFAREAMASATEAVAAATAGLVVAGSAPSQRRISALKPAMEMCTKADLVQQLSALVSQREFSEEELEAALHQLGSSSENFIGVRRALGLCKRISIYPII